MNAGWRGFRDVWLWLAAVPVLLPFWFVLVTAASPASGPKGSGWLPSGRPTTDNVVAAWRSAGRGAVSFGEALRNSTLTTVAVVVLLIVLAAPAGYTLARRGGRLAGAVFAGFAVGLIVPVQLGLITLYGLLVQVGLVGTWIGLVVVYVGFLLPLAVFLYTGFFRGLPTAYEDAASVDGARPWRVLVDIVLPLVRPVTGTVALLTGLFVWNDFFLGLVLVGGTPYETLPVAVYTFVGPYAAQWPLIFAGALIAIVPVLLVYLALQRRIMTGFVSTLHG